MFICERCGKEHDGSYGSGRFCVEKCAKSFATFFKREEINKKVSKKLFKNKGAKCTVCGKKVSHNNVSGFCKNCKPPAKTRSENVIAWRKRNKKRLVDIKGGKCEICGYSKCIGALEFHHLDPSKKDFAISGKNLKNLERYIEEIKKCILVCSNCHREIHNGMTDKIREVLLTAGCKPVGDSLK